MALQILNLLFLLIAFTVIIDSLDGASSEDNEDSNKLAIANNNLGLKLYQLLVKGTTENVFFSPFSLSNAFGMLFAGTKENTAEQLRSALGYDAASLETKNVPAAFNQYLNLVLPKNQSLNPEYTFNLANEILLGEGFRVESEYKNIVKDFFHAIIKVADFRKNSYTVMQEVNDWVKEQTHGKIDKLLSDLSSSTVMLILNAIYFKGTWKIQFDEKMTKTETFYNDGSNSNAKEVPLMHVTAKFPYTSTHDLQALEMPYKGDNISMIILLPKDIDGLTNIENTITPEKLMAIQKQMYTTKVIVTFPKFKEEYKRTMNSDFKNLGANDIFNPESADFSGISQDNGIYVSQVIHKAAIEVNEEGSEAAAATAIGIETLAIIENPKFTADHPFMFAIIDKRNDLILFLGRVTEL